MDSQELRLEVLTVEPENSPETPRGVLVCLHGRGADERDLLPLARELDPEKRMLWAFPRGPFPFGQGVCWYHFGGVGQPEPDSFRQSLLALQNWLSNFLRERNLTMQQVVLGGFSQGAVMSYALGLDPALPRPAGILALSGYLPRVDGWSLSRERARDLDIMIQHGEQDPVIVFEQSRKAQEFLEEAGAKVRWHPFDGGHWVDPAGIALARSWLEQVLR